MFSFLVLQANQANFRLFVPVQHPPASFQHVNTCPPSPRHIPSVQSRPWQTITAVAGEMGMGMFFCFVCFDLVSDFETDYPGLAISSGAVNKLAKR